jgi:pilus assembly protein Flp/PilA
MNMLSMLALKAQMILQNEEGQDLIEYALLVGFISLAAVAAISGISKEVSSIYSSIGSALGTA